MLKKILSFFVVFSLCTMPVQAEELPEGDEYSLVSKQAGEQQEVFVPTVIYAVGLTEQASLDADSDKKDIVQTYALSHSNSLSFNGGAGNISIDGDFSDWEGLPYSYEYNWDNSQNCWYWGVWVNGVCYKTPVGEYSTDVRHKMQLYCDGSYVYLHVIISMDYGSRFNGEDYQFWIDGNQAAFQVEWPGGGTITGNLEGLVSPGTYEVEVKHRNSSMSYEKAVNSSGYLKVMDDYINNELEIAIPLSEMVRQNNTINLDTMSVIEFFTPNLMYRRITCAGTSTFPVILAIIAVLAAGCGSAVYIKRKKDMQCTDTSIS